MADDSETKALAKTDVLGRKVWDKEYYAKRAQVRKYEDGQEFDVEDILDEGTSRKKARKEPPPPSERRPLEWRKDVVPLDNELGRSKIVTTHTPKQQQGGYWCDVCECLIKDSQAYLDHINGKRHNRLLGMTMRVERVGIDRVKQRLNRIKQEKEEQERKQQVADYSEVELRLIEAEKEEKKRKKEKRDRKKRKKKKLEHNQSDNVGENDDDHDALVGDSPAEIAARIRQMFESANNGET